MSSSSGGRWTLTEGQRGRQLAGGVPWTPGPLDASVGVRMPACAARVVREVGWAGVVVSSRDLGTTAGGGGVVGNTAHIASSMVQLQRRSHCDRPHLPGPERSGRGWDRWWVSSRWGMARASALSGIGGVLLGLALFQEGVAGCKALDTGCARSMPGVYLPAVRMRRAGPFRGLGHGCTLAGAEVRPGG